MSDFKRGEIWMMRKYDKKIPVIIVSNNDYNKSAMNIITVAVSGCDKVKNKHNTDISIKYPSTGEKAIARCSAVHVTRYETLYQYVGELTEPEMKRVNEGLRKTLDL